MSTEFGPSWCRRLSADVDEPGEVGAQACVSITVDGRAVRVPADVSLAAALMLSGVQCFGRRPVQGGARLPYCMMGICFECLVDVDDTPGRQACMTPVRAGMRVATRGVASRLAPVSAVAPQCDPSSDGRHE
ncbi:(2Fe-2S)-binding protein [Burkholderia plantarii]|uniref:(2Fe-2S)-binding protein n=1 Tax=Burkholderia plantarii TaxID=41899 RepID=UPI0018DDB3F3|nr:(2Fe-2S)-binding protein [Burkholderia plantarii]MBI0329471.1 (2Fe-2S)-binding protein [Burkholderia plantarii]